MHMPRYQRHLDNDQPPHVSAKTIRVRLAFSMENLTFPPSPAIRPGYQLLMQNGSRY